MSNDPRQKLRTIIQTHGPAVCGDVRRCEALIRDICGDKTLESQLLVQALRQQVPAELLAVPVGSSTHPALLARMKDRLESNLGLSDTAARWAVESWALALGVLAAPTPAAPTMPRAAAVTPTMPMAASAASATTPMTAAPAAVPAATASPALSPAAEAFGEAAAIVVCALLGGFVLFGITALLCWVGGDWLGGFVGWFVRTAALTFFLTVLAGATASRINPNAPGAVVGGTVGGSLLLSCLLFSCLNWRLAGFCSGTTFSLMTGLIAATIFLGIKGHAIPAVVSGGLALPTALVLLLFAFFFSPATTATQEAAKAERLVGKWRIVGSSERTVEFTKGGLMIYGSETRPYRVKDANTIEVMYKSGGSYPDCKLTLDFQSDDELVVSNSDSYGELAGINGKLQRVKDGDKSTPETVPRLVGRWRKVGGPGEPIEFTNTLVIVGTETRKYKVKGKDQVDVYIQGGAFTDLTLTLDFLNEDEVVIANSNKFGPLMNLSGKFTRVKEGGKE